MNAFTQPFIFILTESHEEDHDTKHELIYFESEINVKVFAVYIRLLVGPFVVLVGPIVVGEFFLLLQLFYFEQLSYE